MYLIVCYECADLCENDFSESVVLEHSCWCTGLSSQIRSRLSFWRESRRLCYICEGHMNGVILIISCILVFRN